MKRALACVALALLLLSRAAGAEPPRGPVAPLARSLEGDSRALYDSARDLFKAGDYASAYAKFQRALELSKDPRLHWNLAACERKSKHNANAIRLVELYLREGEGWLTEDDKKEARRAADAVRAFVASARVSTQPEDGVEIFVDDVRVATTPVERPIWIDMGPHRVRFAKAGYKAIERNEDVSAGADLTWAVELERAGTPPAAPPSASPPPAAAPASARLGVPVQTAPSRTGPVVVGAVGLAAAAAGGVLVTLSSREFTALRDECGPSCDRSRWEGHRTTQYVGDGLLIAGGAIFAAGVVWWLATPPGSPRAARAWLAPASAGVSSGIVF